LEFTRKLIQLRKSQAVLCRRRHLRGNVKSGLRDIVWYLPEGREPTQGEWHDTNRRCLGWVMDGNAITDLSAAGVIHIGPTLLIIMNAQFESADFKLPVHADAVHQWQLLISTDRTLKPKINTEFSTGEIFKMRDHSVSIFQQHVKKEAKPRTPRKPLTPRAVA